MRSAAAVLIVIAEASLDKPALLELMRSPHDLIRMVLGVRPGIRADILVGRAVHEAYIREYAVAAFPGGAGVGPPDNPFLAFDQLASVQHAGYGGPYSGFRISEELVTMHQSPAAVHYAAPFQMVGHHRGRITGEPYQAVFRMVAHAPFYPVFRRFPHRITSRSLL